MKLRISTPWDQRKHAREGKADAEHEVEVSQKRFDDAKNKTLSHLRSLREQNHFAELLAESLAKGYNKK